MYRYALAVLANPADAEDVTQTTFLNAYRAFQRGQRPERPRNWLIAIAQNVCRQRFRQAARRPGEVALDEDAAGAAVEDEPPQLDDVRAALSRLAFNQRAALVMREVQGYSYAEIAEALDLSLGAVETLLFRARRALREQLETTLTCGEAGRAISRQLDGSLGRAEKSTLRAHLRACPECATLARRMRAQRSALKALAVVPLPSSLGTFLGGSAAVGTGATALGAGVAIKAAAFGAATLLIGGGGYEAVHHTVRHREARPHASALARVRRPAPAVSVHASVAAPIRPGTTVAAAVTRHRPAPDTHAKVAKRPAPAPTPAPPVATSSVEASAAAPTTPVAPSHATHARAARADGASTSKPKKAKQKTDAAGTPARPAAPPPAHGAGTAATAAPTVLPPGSAHARCPPGPAQGQAAACAPSPGTTQPGSEGDHGSDSGNSHSGQSTKADAPAPPTTGR